MSLVDSSKQSIVTVVTEVSVSAPQSEVMTSESLPIIATKSDTQGPKTFQSVCSSTKKYNESSYRIPGNFRGAKFSRISRSLLYHEIKFRENNRHATPFILHTWIIRENIFREFLFRENLAPRKFPGIR